MSIIKPHKLGIIAGPGTEYLTGKVMRHLRRLYVERYKKVSSVLARRHNMTEEEILHQVIFTDDLNNRKIPRGKAPKTFQCPDLSINVKYTRFANGEVKAEMLAPVRGLRIFLIHDVTNESPIKVAGLDEPQVFSINDHLMFLFTTINALKLAGADNVTLVLPTYPYARQHKKSAREALTASMFGHICEMLGVNRIITLDIHSREIENSFTTLHLENLHASYQTLIQLNKVIDISDPDIVVVAPDTGAISRNKFYAQALHRPLAMLYKERDYSMVSRDAKHSNIKSINLLGDVKGKTVLIADDMIATGGTMIIAMRTLKEMGAKKIICMVSLPFFNGSGIEDFDAAYKEGSFYRIIGTNAVYHGRELTDKEWFIQADVSELFARVISRLHHGRPISPLLDNRAFIQNLIDAKQAHPQAPFEASDASASDPDRD
ncbi:ribose-phosphate diphosphokinase [Parasphaerochaeta coccoides]|uniref:ribose-phosphate diphosphokinase n=1 Tax=Parasphaerochaeta coccoides (strain ATCC BAA-1237 / DSM 17374 / SPN1) TaxID=760011 RepID=F4GJK2_PARC1|nr:ribose-phosphate diphosphokinase [Parasphaerochaeta coccoides]AEC02267.1 ribose-phosphate pyrophosphokinase [Parasphaerochaeta coccoides DSM 17374]